MAHQAVAETMIMALTTIDIRPTLRDYERISRVLRTGGRWDMERLRFTLAALLVRNSDQEIDFEVEEKGEINEGPSAPAQTAESTPQFSNPPAEDYSRFPFGFAASYRVRFTHHEHAILARGRMMRRTHPTLAQPKISRSTPGRFSTILSKAFAAPEGSRRPCSQSCRVRLDTPRSPANCA